MTASHPSRRGVLAGAAAWATIGVIPTPARAAAYSWKFALNAPIEHPNSVRVRQMCDAIRRETNGRLDIAVFPASLLGGDVALLGQLRTGAIQFYLAPGGILSGIVPPAALDSVAFSFPTSEDALRAFDGDVGAYVRGEIAAKGLYALPSCFENGFRQITSGSKPIRTVDDIQGFKIRIAPVKIYLDLFTTLGAAPTPINVSELYTALQTHVVDGQENPYAVIETQRFYEVQKFLTVSNHAWGMFWILSSNETWNSLPADLRAVVERNARRTALAQRRDIAQYNVSLVDKLRRQGLTMVRGDTAGFRAKLGAYYGRWKSSLGTTGWTLLERHAGTLA